LLRCLSDPPVYDCVINRKASLLGYTGTKLARDKPAGIRVTISRGLKTADGATFAQYSNRRPHAA
jgi:hypothetical protein